MRFRIRGNTDALVQRGRLVWRHHQPVHAYARLNLFLALLIVMRVCRDRVLIDHGRSSYVGSGGGRHGQCAWNMRPWMGGLADADLRYHWQLGHSVWRLHAYARSCGCVLCLTIATELHCAGVNDSSANSIWTTANAGDMSVSGSCYPDTSGSPRRDCFYNGTWSDVLNPCSIQPCDALTNDYHANWPSPRFVDTVVNGTCVPGYKSSGTPTRLCQQNGQWDAVISNPCEPIYCTQDLPSYQSFFAVWPESIQAGSTASGTCVAGYTGTTTRSCLLSGEWATPSPLCAAIMCAAITNDGQQSSWPSTQAGQVAAGSCFAGFEGSPARACSITGQWETVSDPCTQKKCIARSEGDADWPATVGGVTVSGTCKEGLYGTVSRSCSTDGVWQPISGACERAFLGFHMIIMS